MNGVVIRRLCSNNLETAVYLPKFTRPRREPTLRSGRRRLCVAVALALVLASPATVRASQVATSVASDSIAAAIHRFENQLAVAADEVGSITAAVAVGNSVIWARSFGYADADAQTPAGVETIYPRFDTDSHTTAV